MLPSLNNLGHAYILVGSIEEGESLIQNTFGKEEVRLTGSPDFFVYKESTFGIDEARSLSISAQLKAFTKRKVYLIAPERITLEAQNALLKAFEEPIANTHFFVIVREAEIIIPTLRSRMEVLVMQRSVSHKEAEKFLKLSLKDRLAFVKKFVDADNPPAGGLSAFLDEILLTLRGNGSTVEPLQNVYKLRLMSDDRAASARLILEHLALVLP